MGALITVATGIVGGIVWAIRQEGRVTNYCASTGVLTQARASKIYAEMIAASKPFFT